MKIVILGTNGWYDTETGNTTCVLIETRDVFVVLDAGTALYKLDRYIKSRKPIFIFLSHFHLDHVIGLHSLAKFNFTQGINVYGPKGIKRMFRTIINKPYTMPVNKLRTKLVINELNKDAGLPIKVEFKKLKHAGACYGYRFILENRIVSYITDTGVCNNLFILARHADLLIVECSLLPGEKNKKWPHLNPQDAAIIAKEAKAKKLALIHFDANAYQDFKKRKLAKKFAQEIFPGQVFAPQDNTEIEI